MVNSVDLIILGSGPAGITSAIYAKRSGLKIALIENEIPGGRLLNTDSIENYPGFSKVKGLELAQAMISQLIENDIKIIQSKIKSIKIKGEQKEVVFEGGDIYISKAMIIATGTKGKPLDVSGYDKFLNKGVSGCIVCDGPLFRGKDVAVIGGGNSAYEEGLYSSGIMNKLYLINKFGSSIAEEITQDKVKNTKNIIEMPNTDIKSINGESSIESITIIDVINNKESELPVSAVFVYIGNDPNTHFFIDTGILNKDGYIETDENMATKIDGVFAAGDVIDKKVRQITTAQSDGTIAALNAHNFLK